MKPSAPLSLADRIQHCTGVIAGTVGDEAVLVTPSQARVRMLNESGSRLWALADGSHTLQEMADILVAEYEVTLAIASADVLAFAADLLAAGLVEVVA
jgi:hypothetical protein